MKILFILAFVLTPTLIASPAILAKRITVPAPKVITFSKKTGRFIKNF